MGSAASTTLARSTRILGIAFGYELVDQDMEIDYPDLDHPDEWDGVPKPSKLPEIAMGVTPDRPLLPTARQGSAEIRTTTSMCTAGRPVRFGAAKGPSPVG